MDYAFQASDECRHIEDGYRAQIEADLGGQRVNFLN
jgi:hypothetical protein